MAIHISFSEDTQMTNDPNMVRYHTVSPNNIHTIFENVTEQELIEKTAFLKPTIINNQLDKKQYWIRYLLCCGRHTDAINEMQNILNNNVSNLNIYDFLNSVHEDFNGNTILHHAVQWCPNIELIQYIIRNGGEVDIQDNDGKYAEEGIENSIWYNPFSRILNMPNIFYHNQIDEFGNIERDIWYIRDINDFNHVINYISIIAGEGY